MTECVDGVVQTLVDIGAELGKTPAQVAFAWILDHAEITAAISGPDLPEHIEEVCGAVGWQLDEEARSKLDEVSRFTPLKSYV
jgi:aryl-alcohol dehydrogenase-like predicted oxidoreductase